MKTYSIIFSLLALLFVAFNSQAQETLETQPVNPNAAEITFKFVEYNYGTINKGDNGDSEFTFTNTGKEPLILTNVRSSCGCTVPAWTKEPVLPGKTGSIKVKYATTRIGQINKSITVESNAKNSPVVLRISGNVLDTPTFNGPEKVNEGAPVAR